MFLSFVILLSFLYDFFATANLFDDDSYDDDDDNTLLMRFIWWNYCLAVLISGVASMEQMEQLLPPGHSGPLA